MGSDPAESYPAESSDPAESQKQSKITYLWGQTPLSNPLSPRRVSDPG